MDFYLSQLSELNIGQMLLLGFWGTCVVMCYSLIIYTFFQFIKSFIVNLVKKLSYGKVR